MEPLIVSPNSYDPSVDSLHVASKNEEAAVSKRKPFIEANTVEGNLSEMNNHHIIPVFARDNERMIAHTEFIETTREVAQAIFPSEHFSEPAIRLSHPILGRTPEAKDKPVKDLLESEKTLYYQRMAFLIEVTSIKETIAGETLSLSLGGVKCYNEDNEGGRSGSLQHFHLFVGFKVSVCTNLCVWTDGCQVKVGVRSLGELRSAIQSLVQSFDAISTLVELSSLQNYSLSEGQFATLIGRCRMYPHLPPVEKSRVPELLFGDSQIAAVCRDYYKDDSFCRKGDGIDLWRLYNLFTSANRSSYIDSFVGRGVNASTLVSNLAYVLENGVRHWYLH